MMTSCSRSQSRCGVAMAVTVRARLIKVSLGTRHTGPSSLVVSSLSVVAFTGADALIEETTLHGVARQRERRSEVLTRCLMPAAAKLKFAARRRIERICSETIAVCDRVELFESVLWAIALGDSDGSIERNNWRGTNCNQSIVERNDGFPVCFLGTRRGRMNRCDGCLDVILCEFRTRSRKLHELQPF